MDQVPPLFILGAPRSGTSLLTRIINAHPDIGVPFETQFYRDFYPLRARYGDLERERSRERLVRDMLAGSHMREIRPLPSPERILQLFTRHDMHGALDALMRAWLETQGKSRWAEKTPPHTLCWRDLVGGFPDAKLIGIMRDGRDSTLSWRMAPFGPKHYVTLARKWTRYIEALEAARAALPPGQFLQLRYEDLVADPERTTRDVCAFLGIPFSDTMLDFHLGADRYVTDSRNIANLARPVMRDNPGKWRTGMSPRDLRIFEAVAGDTLTRAGYERALPLAHLGRLEAARMRWLEAPAAKIRQLAASPEGRQSARRLIATKLLTLRRWRLRA